MHTKAIMEYYKYLSTVSLFLFRALALVALMMMAMMMGRMGFMDDLTSRSCCNSYHYTIPHTELFHFFPVSFFFFFCFFITEHANQIRFVYRTQNDGKK